MNLLESLLILTPYKEYVYWSRINKFITPFLSSANDIITLLNAKRPELIETLSLNLSPVAPDFLILSDPAKSTKLILRI